MSIEELEAESGRIYDIIADIEAGEPPSLDDVQWMIQRIAELEEALDMLAITTRKYRSLPRIDGDTIGRLEAELSKALEKARAVLGGAPIVCGAHQEGAVGLPKGAS